MIQYLVLLLGFFLTYKIFKNRASYVSLLWVIISALLINWGVIVMNIPITMPIIRWLFYSLFAVELLQISRFKNNWRSFPLKGVIIFLIAGSFAVGLFDNRFNIFYKFYNPFMDIVDTYFIIFISYVTINTRNEIYFIKKPIFYALVIVTLYGIFNFISRTNPYFEFVINNFLSGRDESYNSKLNILTDSAGRFRTTSTFFSPFQYGYVSALITLYFLYLLVVYKKRKSTIFIGIVAGLTGVFLCFSRTVLLITIFAVVIYILLVFNLSKKLQTGLLVLGIGLFTYFTVPVVAEAIDNSIDIFISGGENTKGSSVEMRTAQLLGATKYFLQNPIRGNGYFYIRNELGWGDRDKAKLDSNMYGFESIVYQLMIEQGLIGLLTKLLFFIVLIIYFFRKRKIEKKLASLGISITLLFLSFSVGTGALGTWPLTMAFLGIIIKTIQLNKMI